MANEIKKYLSLEGLQDYDGRIKAKIEADAAAAQQAAIDHADSLATNYDPAGTAQTKVDALANGQVKTNTDAIAAINDEKTGILKQAKDHADGKDAAIQAAADAASAAQTAADNAQTAADNAQTDVDALVVNDGENKGRIPTLEEKVQNLITNAYDDTELRGLISGNAGDIDALEGRAGALEDTVTTLVGDDADKSVRTIANEELAKQLIAEGAKESLDTLTEIAAWIQSHPDDASAMNKAIEDLEALVGTLPEGITATTIVGYIQEAVAAEKSRAELAEGALSDRLDTVEGLLGDGENNVDARIAAAKQEAINTAAGDATTKAGQALTDAKGYTDTEIDKVEATVGTNTQNITSLTGRMDAAEDAIDALETSLAEGGATAVAIAAAKQAGDDAQADVDALVAEGGRIPTLESKVATLESVTWTEISGVEIAAMFA